MKLFLKAPENLVLKHDMNIYDKISKALGSNLDKSSFFIFVFAGLAWQHEQTRSQVCVCRKNPPNTPNLNSNTFN